VSDWFEESVSTEGVDPNSLLKGTVRTKGMYHAECIAVKPDEDRNGNKELRFDFQVLAGDHQHEVGNIFYHREKNPNGNSQRVFYLTKLAVQLGVVSKDDVGPGKPPLNLRKLFDAEGKQYVIEVVETTGKKPDDGSAPKVFQNLGRVFNVNDEAVKHVKKDMDAYEAAGGTKPAAATPASTAKFDDL
jgi:hypothetical protein